MYRSIDLQIHRSTDPSIHRSIDLQIHRSTDPSIHRSNDPQIHRSNDPQIHRSNDLQIHWCNDPTTYWTVIITPALPRDVIGDLVMVHVPHMDKFLYFLLNLPCNSVMVPYLNIHYIRIVENRLWGTIFNTGKRPEWSPIRSVIIRVITKIC